MVYESSSLLVLCIIFVVTRLPETNSAQNRFHSLEPHHCLVSFPNHLLWVRRRTCLITANARGKWGKSAGLCGHWQTGSTCIAAASGPEGQFAWICKYWMLGWAECQRPLLQLDKMFWLNATKECCPSAKGLVWYWLLQKSKSKNTNRLVQWCFENYGSSTLPSVEYIYILVS